MKTNENQIAKAIQNKYKEIAEFQKEVDNLKTLLSKIKLDKEKEYIQHTIDFLLQKIQALENSEINSENFESIINMNIFNYETLDSDKSKIEYIINNLIVKNEITMIASKPSGGKSLTALGICTSFLKQSIEHKVVYFDLDNSIATLTNRKIYKIRNKFGSRFNMFSSSNYSAEEANIFLNKFKNVDLTNTLFILDSIKNFILGDRDKNKDVSEFMRLVKALRDAGATVIFLHHTNKPQKDLGENYAGSSAFLEDTTNAFILENNPDKQTFIFKTIKARNGDLKNKAFQFDLDKHKLIEVDLLWASENKNDTKIVDEIIEFLSNNKEANYTQIKNYLIGEGIVKDKSKIANILNNYCGVLWAKEKIKENNKSIYKLIKKAIKNDNANTIDGIVK